MPPSTVSKAVGQELALVLPPDAKAWWRQSHLLRLNLLLFSCMLISSTVGYDNSMMNGLQSLQQWQDFMHHPEGAYLGAINAVQAAGACLGYPFMSIIANKYGRKTSVFIGLAVITLGTGLQVGARNPAMFIVSRFFVGSASGFLGAAPLLVTETAFPTHRGKLTAGYNTLYYIGSLVSAWTTFGCRELGSSWAWRIPSLLQIAVPTLAFTGILLAPESPRWQISVGRNEEARRTLVKYHAGGDENSALVNYEMAEIQETLRLEAEFARTTSYLDMIKTKGNRHRLFITISIGIFAQWNGVGVVSYYLSVVLKTVGITSVTQQTLINGFLQLWNLIIAVSAAGLVDRLGRRFLFMASSIGMLVCYVVITGISGSFAETAHAATGLAVIPMLFLYYGFYDIAFTPFLIAYPAEIWPYRLRSRGVALVQMSTFAALFFNLFVNPIALGSIGWKYYIAYICILIVICFVCWFFYPETRGYTLEEMAVVFDGDNAAVPRKGSVLETVDQNQQKKNDEGGKMSHMEYVNVDTKV